jgi:hypothetical protein
MKTAGGKDKQLKKYQKRESQSMKEKGEKNGKRSE